MEAEKNMFQLVEVAYYAEYNKDKIVPLYLSRWEALDTSN
jgi:hypothetical protein